MRLAEHVRPAGQGRPREERSPVAALVLVVHHALRLREHGLDRILERCAADVRRKAKINLPARCRPFAAVVESVEHDIRRKRIAPSIEAASMAASSDTPTAPATLPSATTGDATITARLPVDVLITSDPTTCGQPARTEVGTFAQRLASRALCDREQAASALAYQTAACSGRLVASTPNGSRMRAQSPERASSVAAAAASPSRPLQATVDGRAKGIQRNACVQSELRFRCSDLGTLDADAATSRTNATSNLRRS